MLYDLILFFPNEQYSIEKGNNKFVATDKEGNRFIMAANNKQKETISFCKDDLTQKK